MDRITRLYTSSVGRKLIVGGTGFFLCTFLVVHLYVNLFLFKRDGGETFELYADFLATYPLVRPIEWLLFGGLLIHAFVGAWLWVKNKQTRPKNYAENKASENSTFTSRFAFVTGSVVFIFLVIHINTFFVKSRFFNNGMTMYDRVIEAFSHPWYDIFYIVSIVFLGYHLKHGFQSAFQTFGIRHEKYQRLIDAIAVVFWLLIPLGFASIPLYFLWAH